MLLSDISSLGVIDVLVDEEEEASSVDDDDDEGAKFKDGVSSLVMAVVERDSEEMISAVVCELTVKIIE